MSPEERQLLSDLFDRIRGQANAPRDRDAETFISDAVRAQPYAPYLLSQAVIVQDHALQAADQRIKALEAQVSQLQAEAQAAPQGGGGFLGGLFGGGGPRASAASQPGPQPSPWGAAPQQPSYAPPPQGGQPYPGPSPWGAPQQPPQGGGFLRNALGAAAGVAGGVMLADSIRGLFSGGGHGSSLFGGSANAAGLEGLGGALGGGASGASGETIINNFFDKPQGGQQDKAQEASLFDQANDRDFTGLSDEDYGGDDSGDYGDDI